MRKHDFVRKVSSQEEIGISNGENSEDYAMEIDDKEDAEELDMKDEFEAAIYDFENEVLKRMSEYTQHYTKCVKSFSKQLRSVTSSHHSNFQKALFSFASDDISSVRQGRKKMAKNIRISVGVVKELDTADLLKK